MSAAVVSSLDLRPVESFTSRGTVVRSDQEPTVANQLRLLVRLLAAGLRGRPLILFTNWGSFKPDLLAAGLLALRPRRSAVVMVGEVWSRSPGPRGRLEAAVIGFGSRGVDRFLTTSAGEAELLTRTWHVPATKAGVARYYYYPPQHGGDMQPERGDHVFAAGDSFRDYAPLLELARRRPDLSFRIATTLIDPDDPTLPPNVQILRVRLAGYRQAMAEAGVVVVPIVKDLDRSAGLLTFLMGMWLHKPVVVTECISAADYIDDGRTGLIVDGTVEDYERVIGWAFDPANAQAVEQMGRAAHREVEQNLTYQAYVDTILGELDAAQARRAALPAATPRGRLSR